MKGPLFKWFGSKWQASKHYPVPQGNVIVEPFAGGAGYSCRHATMPVVLIESNLQLVILWSWLIYEATTSDILDIPVNIPEGTEIKTLDLSYGQMLLLKHWQRTNTYGECWTISPWGNKPGQWTVNTRARVADEVHEVKHWTVSRSLPDNSFDLYSEATWFIDPPYVFNFRYGAKNFDYMSVVNMVRSLPKAQIIACEARCPKTDTMPTYLPFKEFRSTVTSRRKSGEHTHSREVMFYQGRI